MVNRTITDKIYDSYHKGQDPEFERNGVRYKFNPDGLKDFISNSSSEVSWDDVKDKPTTFAPSTHSHTIAQVTGLQTSLDGKALKTELPTTSELVPSGGSNNQVLKVVSGVPSWASETNTTYPIMTAAEASAGTATTARTINASVLVGAITERLPTAGVAVADATDETDVVAQFNALLASLRAANIIAS